MKKIVSVITLFLLIVSAGQTYAQSPVPSKAAADKSAISEKLNQEINNLKEKIASRVSELNLVEKRGIIGTVSEVSGNQVTITDLTGKTRFIDVDEITKFSSPSTKTFGISDLTKGTRITALGLYNKQSKRLLARFINATVDPAFISGTVSSVDAKNFNITVTSADKKEIKVDNQNTTKILTYEKEVGFAKLGFSKLAVGDRTFVMGYPDKTDPKMIVADRIIVIPSLPKNGNVALPAADANPTTAPVKR
jgi:hypothetical protein